MKLTYRVFIEEITAEGRGVPFAPRTMYAVRTEFCGSVDKLCRIVYCKTVALRLAQEEMKISLALQQGLLADLQIGQPTRLNLPIKVIPDKVFNALPPNIPSSKVKLTNTDRIWG